MGLRSLLVGIVVGKNNKMLGRRNWGCGVCKCSGRVEDTFKPCWNWTGEWKQCSRFYSLLQVLMVD